MRFIRTVFLMYMVSSCTNFLYAAPIPEITILTKALGNTGEKFPNDLIKFWETITISQNNNNIEIAPKVKLLRIDLAEEKELGIPLTGSLIDKFIKPDPRVTLKKAHDYLKQSKINSDFSGSQSSDEKQIKNRKEKYQAEIPTILEISQTNSSLAANQLTSVNELLPTLKKLVERDIVAGIDPIKYLVLYNLSTPNTVLKEPVPVESDRGITKTEVSRSTSKCDSKTELNQGIQFISISKGKQTEALRKSDLTNAFQIFDSIVKESSGCCAKALMNKGIVHDLLGEPNLAIIDLKAAEKCDSQNIEVHYNLACHYAKHSTKANQQLDLSLQELEISVKLGLQNCKQILNDPDLKNLRQDKYFKTKLRDMLQQYGQFCITDSR